MSGSGDVRLRLKVGALIGAGRRKARELGWVGFAAYSIRRAFRATVFRKDILLAFVREPADIPPPERHGQGQLELRDLDSTSLRRCQAQQPVYFSTLRILAYEARLARRERCYALFEGETLLNLGWVGLRTALAAAPEVGRRFSVPLSGLLPVIYDCWTPLEFRGRGYYPIALDRVAARLLQEYRQVWIYTLETNVASAKGIQKAGFRLALRHVRTRFIGIERHATTLSGTSQG
jgi:hypothetical protein